MLYDVSYAHAYAFVQLYTTPSAHGESASPVVYTIQHAARQYHDTTAFLYMYVLSS